MLTRTTWKDKVTVAATGTTSTVGEIWGASFGVLIVPSNFDGTTVTFTVGDAATEKGGAVTPTYYALKDASGNAISLTVAASTAVALPPELFGAGVFKIVCGSTQTTTDTIFTIILKG